MGMGWPSSKNGIGFRFDKLYLANQPSLGMSHQGQQSLKGGGDDERGYSNPAPDRFEP